MGKQSYLKWKAIDSIWGKILLQSCEYLKTDKNRYESFVKQRPRRKVKPGLRSMLYVLSILYFLAVGPSQVEVLFCSCLN